MQNVPARAGCAMLQVKMDAKLLSEMKLTSDQKGNWMPEGSPSNGNTYITHKHSHSQPDSHAAKRVILWWMCQHDIHNRIQFAHTHTHVSGENDFNVCSNYISDTQFYSSSVTALCSLSWYRYRFHSHFLYGIETCINILDTVWRQLRCRVRVFDSILEFSMIYWMNFVFFFQPEQTSILAFCNMQTHASNHSDVYVIVLKKIVILSAKYRNIIYFHQKSDTDTQITQINNSNYFIAVFAVFHCYVIVFHSGHSMIWMKSQMKIQANIMVSMAGVLLNLPYNFQSICILHGENFSHFIEWISANASK